MNLIHGDVKLLAQDQLAEIGLLFVHPHLQSVPIPPGYDTWQLGARPQMGIPSRREFNNLVGFLEPLLHVTLFDQLPVVLQFVTLCSRR